MRNLDLFVLEKFRILWYYLIYSFDFNVPFDFVLYVDFGQALIVKIWNGEVNYEFSFVSFGYL